MLRPEDAAARLILGIGSQRRLGVAGDTACIGGYYSFAGIGADAFYLLSPHYPVEEALPVRISSYDDRVEAPEGVSAEVIELGHSILNGIPGDWPVLLATGR